MRLACIDIGSNTTRLLVADCAARQLTEVHQERAFTRIGRGLTVAGTLTDGKIAEVVAVVTAQLAIAADLGATGVVGVATAAVRRAANGAHLVDEIRRATGLEVQILAGKEEARLAFVGAAATLEGDPGGDLGVVDVGGGSTELVVGAVPDAVRWWTSLELGSGGLAEQYLCSDPPSAQELAGARDQIRGALAGLRPPPTTLVVAVGGSATSLARLAGPVLDRLALGRALSVLCAAPASKVGPRFAIDPQRARLLPAGLLVLEGVASLVGAPLRVGRGGIREGVLLEALSQ
jgi:exopolyphosphatase / guanosine-5'-triphosphate,3'-diphosphate pyrophosphatase